MHIFFFEYYIWCFIGTGEIISLFRNQVLVFLFNICCLFKLWQNVLPYVWCTFFFYIFSCLWNKAINRFVYIFYIIMKFICIKIPVNTDFNNPVDYVLWLIHTRYTIHIIFSENQCEINMGKFVYNVQIHNFWNTLQFYVNQITYYIIIKYNVLCYWYAMGVFNAKIKYNWFNLYFFERTFHKFGELYNIYNRYFCVYLGIYVPWLCLC